MTKVILLGDSIRQIGYGTKVPEMLGDGYTVWQPSDNCRFAQYTLRGLFDWKNELTDCYIVHWNNGLWDACELFGDGAFTPIEFYTETMMRIARILKSTAKKVIFATTTPVNPANIHDSNARIIKYNEAIVPKLKAMGVLIDDLHSLVYPKIDEYIRKDDLIHLTDAGIDACAAAVVNSIKQAESLI